MTHNTETTWKHGLHFVTELDDHQVSFDATELSTDNNLGVSPKKIILSGLAGCTGMDVAALLTKRFKVDFSDFNLRVTGELTDHHPKYYHQIHIVYEIKVDKEDQPKVAEAVELSTNKYCGVHEMLKKIANITHEIKFL